MGVRVIAWGVDLDAVDEDRQPLCNHASQQIVFVVLHCLEGSSSTGAPATQAKVKLDLMRHHNASQPMPISSSHVDPAAYLSLTSVRAADVCIPKMLCCELLAAATVRLLHDREAACEHRASPMECIDARGIMTR